MAEYYSIVYMYHNFFIHSSVDGDLGCFYVLAIANSASVNNGIHVSYSQTPNLPSPLFPFDNHKFVFYVCESISVF